MYGAAPGRGCHWAEAASLLGEKREWERAGEGSGAGRDGAAGCWSEHRAAWWHVKGRVSRRLTWEGKGEGEAAAAQVAAKAEDLVRGARE